MEADNGVPIRAVHPWQLGLAKESSSANPTGVVPDAKCQGVRRFVLRHMSFCAPPAALTLPCCRALPALLQRTGSTTAGGTAVGDVVSFRTVPSPAKARRACARGT
eukprot:scaffold8097_cov258-Pinguiococcus_pyrenoidosus.AAC.7